MKIQWNDIIRKLTSRKLWMAVAGVATGIATILGAEANDIQTVSGAVLSAASVLGYIMAEASVDKASLKAANQEESE